MRALRSVVIVSSMAMVVAALACAPAARADTTLFADPFTGPTAVDSDIALPATPATEPQPNVACLTAGTSTATSPVPGCGLSTPDAAGAGALRLTSSAENEEGGVFSTVTATTVDGLDATFDASQYGGDGADGIAFVMAAANPAQPSPPALLGTSGGFLGYTGEDDGGPYIATPGLANGYLGVGLDAYGNFASFQPGTCPAGPGFTPNAVSVRGPGDDESGYCLLSTSGALTGGASVRGTTRATSVPVEVALNPSSQAAVTASGLTVPAGDYLVAFTPVGGSQQELEGALPTTLNGIPAGAIPSSWIDPTTGIPELLTFGWIGSTGGSTDIHEITNAKVTTLTGTTLVPALTLTSSSNPAAAGGAVTLTATVSGSGPAPTGSVIFSEGGTNLGTATVAANGVATLTTSSLSGGSHTITATYSGDADYTSRAASLTETVVVPNGRIVYAAPAASGEDEIFAVSPVGGTARQLTSSSGGSSQPTVSPNGEEIAFVTQTSGVPHIFVLSATGITQVTSGSGEQDPAWSPDGTQLAYVQGGELHVAGAGGTGATSLGVAALAGSSLSWAPDGSQIAYADPSGDLQLESASGGAPTLLFDNGGDGGSSGPAFAPDGSQVAFTNGEIAGSEQVFVIAATGGSPTALTADAPHTDEAASWSPDGSQLAFESNRGGGALQLYTMQADGSGQTAAGPAATAGTSWGLLEPIVTVEEALSPATDPGRFNLMAGSTVLAAAAGNGDSGSALVAPGGLTVSQSATSAPLSGYAIAPPARRTARATSRAARARSR